MDEQKFEIGKLYIWIPKHREEYTEYYVVWKPNRKDIWKTSEIDNTEELKQNSIVTVLDLYKTKNHYDLKIFSTCGILGWVRVCKNFINDWQPVSV